MPGWAAAIEASKGLPVLGRTRGSILFDAGGGLRISACAGRSLHYAAGPGLWLPINTDLVDDGTWLTGVGTPVRIDRVTGAAHRRDGGSSARPSRVVRFRPSNESTAGITNVPSAGGVISGDWYTREWALPTGLIRYRQRCHEDGVYSELWIEAAPTFPGVTRDDDYICLEEEALGYDDLATGWHDAAFVRDGYYYKLPEARDANGATIPIRRYLLESGGSRWWLTGCMKADLDTAVYPVTLDETDYSASTDDGYITGFGPYATARANATSHDTTSASMTVGQEDVGKGNDQVHRIALKFLTAGIGGEVVSDATMDLVCTTDSSLTDFDVAIRGVDWSGSDPITAGNRDTIYDAILAAATDVIWRNTAGIATGTVYTSPSLDPSWVETLAATYYGLISSRDISATDPGGLELIAIASQDHATAGYRPVLTVTHAPAAGGYIPSSLLALGV